MTVFCTLGAVRKLARLSPMLDAPSNDEYGARISTNFPGTSAALRPVVIVEYTATDSALEQRIEQWL
jgi:hypothetical protein